MRGKAVVDGKPVVRRASFQPIRATHRSSKSPLPSPCLRRLSFRHSTTKPTRLAVGLRQAYVIARNGYSGPLEVRPADRRVRYAQGVNGPTLHISEKADGFDYPLTLAPFMEILRTSRTNLMATGIVVDPDGTRHPVTYSTDSQNEQMVSIVSPERMTLIARSGVFLAEPGNPRSLMSAQSAAGNSRGRSASSWSARDTFGASRPSPPIDRRRRLRPSPALRRLLPSGHSTCRSNSGHQPRFSRLSGDRRIAVADRPAQRSDWF